MSFMELTPVVVPADWTSEKDFQPFPVFQFIQFGLVELTTDPGASLVSSSRLFIGGLNWTVRHHSLGTYQSSCC